MANLTVTSFRSCGSLAGGQPVRIKKLIGMMKDEATSKIITEFAALWAKLYSYRMDGEDYKKCKGVKKNVVRLPKLFVY